ncbi:GNAT family N-acetyltransferase [Tenggerimyces flavus]|uniref:GNAT family N-acetyltransferase n=1 Tax=Tenggerimyces flavus TaxID=1708749 RepID=A0ABV7Y5L1_9ACTN|nr:GNAT family N-acetyltransferase [Tenggerimyces flavus]MBM7788383.1 ribosomal protein S18 acetylase RimI-like enzyme [Tenggerimyces flavus]
MTGVEVVELGDPARQRDATTLVFEYFALTAVEIDRPVPERVTDLPPSLRVECEDLAAAYPEPGFVLVAYVDGEPAGVVGLKAPGEVKRLYVRPEHRSNGVGRRLMEHLHERAAERGMRRVVLDVLPSRKQVIDFYRRLGYTDIDPPPGETFPMLYLARNVENGDARPCEG